MRSLLWYRTSIIRSSALVQASSSLSMVALALGHGGHFINNSISAIFSREFPNLPLKKIGPVIFNTEDVETQDGELIYALP